MKLCAFLTVLTLLCTSVFSQQVTLSGKVTDSENKPVPFASVYIKNSSKGASANSDGEYKLAAAPGIYEVGFKAVGYSQQTRRVELNVNKTLNVRLAVESYQIKGVVVQSNSEDPAYAIIHKAIKKRKAHLNEVKAYTAIIYIKGLQKLLAAPKKFLGFDVQKAARENGLDSNRRGIIYLSESESRYSFERPDKVHEELISSKVSGSNRAFSYNRASDLDVNFYKNIQDWGGLSNRPIISPIADNALFYYNYKFIGETIENGETINKIQLIPKRGYDACLSGYIYILEDSWRIYALDVFITKKQNINFVDTLKINEQFLPAGGQAWMPASLKFEFNGGIFGFKYGGYFISVYKDYDLNPSFTKKEFNEVLKITAGVNKKDSVFWQQERPVPLTLEEETDYRKKTILAKKKESKPYLDSLDKVNNKFKPVDALLTGYFHRNRWKHEYFNTDPVLTSIRFNTVEGFNLNLGGSYSKRVDSLTNRYLLIGGKAGYGFSDKRFKGSVYSSVPAGSFTLGFNAGSDIIDLNNTLPISPVVNSLYSLFERRNYKKLYQKQYVSVSIYKRVTGGLQASAAVEFADRKWLPDASSYSFFSPGNRSYTSNNPYIPSQEVPLFRENQSFKIVFRATYDFSNKYETYPNGKRYLPSPYPTIGLNYTKGIKDILGSDVDFDLLSADISKSDISLGVIGKTSFYAGAGKFLNSNSLFYPDYKQFAGNQVFFYKQGIHSFLLLDYYRFSTFTEYVEAHLEHNFSGFILNKLPLIRKLKLQEIVDVNYLSTPTLKNYTELGFGLQYLNFKLMYGTSYNSGSNVHSAIRLGLSF